MSRIDDLHPGVYRFIIGGGYLPRKQKPAIPAPDEADTSGTSGTADTPPP